MLSSRSLIRHYTPPTCTLEIWAKSSPLSRWAGRTLLKKLTFELRFDDPKLPAEKQVTIRGDRSQLELLYETVSHYVQVFLSQPYSQLSLAPPEEHQHTSSKQNSSLLTLPTKPKLQPKGLLWHELFFGSLANEESGNSIRLTASQLFDLASALDEYDSEITALPNLQPPYARHPFLALASSAAVAVLAIALVSQQGQLFTSGEENSQNLASLSEKKKSQPKKLDIVVPPAPPEVENTTINPKLPSTLSTAKKLSPPAPVKLPPPPNLASDTRETMASTLPNVASSASIPLPENPGIVITPDYASNKPSRQSEVKITGITPNNGENRKNPNPTFRNLPSLEPNTVKTDLAMVEISSAEGLDSNPSPLLPESNSLSEATQTETTMARATARGIIPLPQQNLEQMNAIVAEEVKNYFEDKWQPPETLKQSLQYTIVLNTDGSLGRIIPLGNRAKVYLDRTNMPLMGEKFVSPLPEGETSTVRLVLEPDGKVQTFKE